MTRSAGPAYAYDAERIGKLKAAYRGDGPLPREFYVGTDVFNADLDRIWRRHWLYAGHACQLPNAGDWMTWNVGSDTIVITRGADGDVRAFHNSCRHRGARLCNGEHGNSRLLVCPYHAWTYELDGRLRTPTEREFGIHQSKLGLHPVSLKDLGGLLFVALGSEPVSFDEGAAEIAAQMRASGLCRCEGSAHQALCRRCQLEAGVRE